MNYLTQKEYQVEKNWNKRGLAGLRSELLQRIGEPLSARGKNSGDSGEGDERSRGDKSRGDDEGEIVKGVARMVYSALPQREWGKADLYIAETCGLVGIDLSDGAWAGEIMQVRLNEEILREDEGAED